MKHYIMCLLALYVCSARNLLGRYFSATNASQAEARREALSQCQEKSFFGCYPTGCRSSYTEDEEAYAEESYNDEMTGVDVEL